MIIVGERGDRITDSLKFHIDEFGYYTKYELVDSTTGKAFAVRETREEIEKILNDIIFSAGADVNVYRIQMQ